MRSNQALDPRTLAAMSRWPNVPECYGWLHLDRAGQWFLNGEPVRQKALTGHFNNHYLMDECGAWYVQNGPQKAYVNLEAAPFALFVSVGGQLLVHTGHLVHSLECFYMNTDGELYLRTEHGAALASSQALVSLSEGLQEPDGSHISEQYLERMLTGQAVTCTLAWDSQRFPVEVLDDEKIPQAMGFIRNPAAGN